MRNVAQAVGCTKPALYYHFNSKEELFLEVVRTNMDQFTSLIEQTSAKPGTLYDRMLATLRFFFRHIQQRPEVMRLLMTAQHRPEEGRPQIDLLSIHEEQTRLIMGLLSQARNEGEIRNDLDLSQISASLVGLVQAWGMRCVHGLEIPENTSEHILDLFFHGVAPS